MMAKETIEPLFEVDLGSFGGIIGPKDYSDFTAMAEREVKAWDWLTSAPPTDPALISVHTHFLNALNGTLNYARQLEAAGNLQGQDPVSVLRTTYGGPVPGLFHSSSTSGRALRAIGKAFGVDDAVLTYGLLISQISFDVRNPRHFRLLSLVSNPALIEGAAASSTVDELLQNTQDETRRLHRQQLDQISRTQRTWEEKLATGRRLVFKLLKRDIALNRGAEKSHADAVKASIDAIDNTRLAYEAQMQLKAAVVYWTEKSTSHGTKATTSFTYLMRFIVCAAIGATISFWIATSLLLELSGVDAPLWKLTPKQGATPGPASYVIITLAVGTILTALFWAARVLLKTYLTERHLERDASERSVMTQTFLALIKDGGVKDEDRLVILNSLFRPSADLPSSDDGPGDIALPALMARLLDQKKA